MGAVLTSFRRLHQAIGRRIGAAGGKSDSGREGQDLVQRARGQKRKEPDDDGDEIEDDDGDVELKPADQAPANDDERNKKKHRGRGSRTKDAADASDTHGGDHDLAGARNTLLQHVERTISDWGERCKRSGQGGDDVIGLLEECQKFSSMADALGLGVDSVVFVNTVVLGPAVRPGFDSVWERAKATATADPALGLHWVQIFLTLLRHLLVRVDEDVHVQGTQGHRTFFLRASDLADRGTLHVFSSSFDAVAQRVGGIRRGQAPVHVHADDRTNSVPHSHRYFEHRYAYSRGGARRNIRQVLLYLRQLIVGCMVSAEATVELYRETPTLRAELVGEEVELGGGATDLESAYPSEYVVLEAQHELQQDDHGDGDGGIVFVGLPLSMAVLLEANMCSFEWTQDRKGCVVLVELDEGSKLQAATRQAQQLGQVLRVGTHLLDQRERVLGQLGYGMRGKRRGPTTVALRAAVLRASASNMRVVELAMSSGPQPLRPTLVVFPGRERAGYPSLDDVGRPRLKQAHSPPSLGPAVIAVPFAGRVAVGLPSSRGAEPEAQRGQDDDGHAPVVKLVRLIDNAKYSGLAFGPPTTLEDARRVLHELQQHVPERERMPAGASSSSSILRLEDLLDVDGVDAPDLATRIYDAIAKMAKSHGRVLLVYHEHEAPLVNDARLFLDIAVSSVGAAFATQPLDDLLIAASTPVGVGETDSTRRGVYKRVAGDAHRPFDGATSANRYRMGEEVATAGAPACALFGAHGEAANQIAASFIIDAPEGCDPLRVAKFWCAADPASADDMLELMLHGHDAWREAVNADIARAELAGLDSGPLVDALRAELRLVNALPPLASRSLWLAPSLLRDARVQTVAIEQRVGDLVLTGQRVLHFGANTQPATAEAINLLTAACVVSGTATTSMFQSGMFVGAPIFAILCSSMHPQANVDQDLGWFGALSQAIRGAEALLVRREQRDKVVATIEKRMDPLARWEVEVIRVDQPIVVLATNSLRLAPAAADKYELVNPLPFYVGLVQKTPSASLGTRLKFARDSQAEVATRECIYACSPCLCCGRDVSGLFGQVTLTFEGRARGLDGNERGTGVGSSYAALCFRCDVPVLRAVFLREHTEMDGEASFVNELIASTVSKLVGTLSQPGAKMKVRIRLYAPVEAVRHNNNRTRKVFVSALHVRKRPRSGASEAASARSRGPHGHGRRHRHRRQIRRSGRHRNAAAAAAAAAAPGAQQASTRTTCAGSGLVVSVLDNAKKLVNAARKAARKATRNKAKHAKQN